MKPTVVKLLLIVIIPFTFGHHVGQFVVLGVQGDEVSVELNDRPGQQAKGQDGINPLEFANSVKGMSIQAKCFFAVGSSG